MKIHFAGIGGCGVSGLALIAKSMGHDVSGCDIAETSYSKMVKKKGVDVVKGHDSSHLEDVDMLVYSNAFDKNEPEFKVALEKGIEMHKRGDFLAALINSKGFIGVAGSHGKTSVTWLIYHILKHFGLNPSVYAGGKCNGETTVIDGLPWIAELDESDGTIFSAFPEILALNNLEHEHADFYPTENVMLRSFEQYLFKLRQNGADFVIGHGYKLSDVLINEFDASSFPSKDEIELGISINDGEFDLISDGKEWSLFDGVFEYYAGNYHDPYYIIQNRLSALIASIKWARKHNVAIVPYDNDFWEKIPGVDRRFQKIGTFKNAFLIDDYGHHPSEVFAAVTNASIQYGKNYLLVFQAHRTTRFSAFYEQFKTVLENVPRLVIMPVYTAGEKEKGKTAKELFEELKEKRDNIFYCEKFDEIKSLIIKIAENEKLKAVITVGAGNVNELFEKLKEDEV